MPLASAVLLTEAIPVSSTQGRWGFVFHFCSVAFYIVSLSFTEWKSIPHNKINFLIFSFPETEIRENFFPCESAVPLLPC